jgi:ATP-dependent exoDNAse (exonuclease V) alpha subunit
MDTRTFDVSEKKRTEVVIGEKILIQSNHRDLQNKERNLTNGEILTVSKVLEDGALKTTEGKIIPKEFDTFDHGYATTSYGSQGKTCDHVIVSMNISSGKAVSMNQFYVSASRGRESISIYVDDKEYIKEKILNNSSRESVMEFLKLDMPARNKERDLSPKWVDKTREFYHEIKERVVNLFERERKLSIEPER